MKMMKNNRSITRFLELIGIISIITFVLWFLNFVNKRTETRLYSEEAMDKLQDPKELSKLNARVQRYHEEGVWN
jgi:hypothetical protein